MSPLSIDYNSLLSQSDPPIGLPYDVTFLIFNKEKELQGEVQGHKFIFAHNSSVFRTKFCGSGDFADKTDKQVKITGSVEAFQLITAFLYNKLTAIKELSVDKIFDVVDLVHFYDITKLEKALEQRLEKIFIAKDDVMKAAKTAEEFARFESASQALLKNCAKTLQAALNDDAKKFYKFSSQVAGSGDEVIGFRLLTMIKDLPPLPTLPPLCSNCQKSPCLSGAEVTSISQVRLGTRLAPNPSYWYTGFGRTEVVSVDASATGSGGTVKVKAGDGTMKFSTARDYAVEIPCGGSFFHFACST